MSVKTIGSAFKSDRSKTRDLIDTHLHGHQAPNPLVYVGPMCIHVEDVDELEERGDADSAQVELLCHVIRSLLTRRANDASVALPLPSCSSKSFMQVHPFLLSCRAPWSCSTLGVECHPPVYRAG